MKKLKFRVTATISKIIAVEVEEGDLHEDLVVEIGRERAHEMFRPNVDGFEESYKEDSVLIKE